jgi:hypothetical protein
LAAFLALEDENLQRRLPIWHNVTRDHSNLSWPTGWR